RRWRPCRKRPAMGGLWHLTAPMNDRPTRFRPWPGAARAFPPSRGSPRESSQQPEGSMKLIPVISRRPGGRRARRLPPLVTITACLALLVPLSFAAPALAGTELAGPALAGTAHPGSAAAAGQGASPSCPWLNQSLSVAQRVHLLLSKMTL